MSVTPETFILRYPEFSEIDPSRIQILIDDSILEMNESFWDTLYDKGLSALTAHVLQLSIDSENGDSSAIVVSKTVGDVATTFGAYLSVKQPQSNIEAYYNSSKYGRDYYRLLQMIGCPVLVAHEDFSS